MSVKYLTRAQLREAVRTSMGQPTPLILGIPGAVAGQELPTYRDPRNAALNQYIDEVLASFNNDAKISAAPSPLQANIAAQSVNGPYGLHLGAGFNLPNSVTDLRHVWWIDTGSSTSIPLTWQSLDEMNGQYPYWQDMAPSEPQFCWMEGYQVKVWPAPANAGILYATASIAFADPTLDTDVITILPSDFLPAVNDAVILRACEAQGDNLIRQSQYQMIMGRAQKSRDQLITFMNSRNGGGSGYTAGIKYKPTTNIIIGRTR